MIKINKNLLDKIKKYLQTKFYAPPRSVILKRASDKYTFNIDLHYKKFRNFNDQDFSKLQKAIEYELDNRFGKEIYNYGMIFQTSYKINPITRSFKVEIITDNVSEEFPMTEPSKLNIPKYDVGDNIKFKSGNNTTETGIIKKIKLWEGDKFAYDISFSPSTIFMNILENDIIEKIRNKPKEQDTETTTSPTEYVVGDKVYFKPKTSDNIFYGEIERVTEDRNGSKLYHVIGISYDVKRILYVLGASRISKDESFFTENNTPTEYKINDKVEFKSSQQKDNLIGIIKTIRGDSYDIVVSTVNGDRRYTIKRNAIIQKISDKLKKTSPPSILMIGDTVDFINRDGETLTGNITYISGDKSSFDIKIGIKRYFNIPKKNIIKKSTEPKDTKPDEPDTFKYGDTVTFKDHGYTYTGVITFVSYNNLYDIKTTIKTHHGVLKSSILRKIDIPDTTTTSTTYKVNDIIEFESRNTIKIGKITYWYPPTYRYTVESRGSSGFTEFLYITKNQILSKIDIGDVVEFKLIRDSDSIIGKITKTYTGPTFSVNVNNTIYTISPTQIIKKIDKITYNVGDKVEFNFGGNYFTGIVKKLENDNGYITIEGYNKDYPVKVEDIIGLYKDLNLGDIVTFTADGTEMDGVVVEKTKDDSTDDYIYQVLNPSNLKTYKNVRSNLKLSEKEYKNPFETPDVEFSAGDFVVFNNDVEYELKNGDKIQLKDKPGKLKSKYVKNSVQYGLVVLSDKDVTENIKVPLYLLDIDENKIIYKKGKYVYGDDNLTQGNKEYRIYRKVGRVIDNVNEGEDIPVYWMEDVGGNDYFGKYPDGHCLFVPPELLKPFKSQYLVPDTGMYNYVYKDNDVIAKNYIGMTENDIKFINSKLYHKVESMFGENVRLYGYDELFSKSNFSKVEVKIPMDDINIGDYVKYVPTDVFLSVTDKDFLSSKPYHEVMDTSNYGIKIDGSNFYISRKHIKKIDLSEVNLPEPENLEEENESKKYIDEHIDETWMHKMKFQTCEITALKPSVKYKNYFIINYTADTDEGVKRYFVEGSTNFLDIYRLPDKKIDVKRIDNAIENINSEKEIDVKKLKRQLSSYKLMGTISSNKLKDLKNQQIESLMKKYKDKYIYLNGLKDFIISLFDES